MKKLLGAMILFGAVSAYSAGEKSRGYVVGTEGGQGNVCLGSEHVAVGDTVTVFSVSCERTLNNYTRTPRMTTNCVKQPKGAAVVTDLHNGDFSTVRAVGNTVLQPGDLVEIIK